MAFNELFEITVFKRYSPTLAYSFSFFLYFLCYITIVVYLLCLYTLYHHFFGIIKNNYFIYFWRECIILFFFFNKELGWTAKIWKDMGLIAQKVNFGVNCTLDDSSRYGWARFGGIRGKKISSTVPYFGNFKNKISSTSTSFRYG